LIEFDVNGDLDTAGDRVQPVLDAVRHGTRPPHACAPSDLSFRRPHTLVPSLALVPAGLVLLLVTMLMVNPLARAFRPIVSALLPAAEAGRTATTPVAASGPPTRATDGPLERLTPREREVLGLMAEGRSNGGIAEALVLTVGAAEKHQQ
jgi:hypothetical protein